MRTKRRRKRKKLELKVFKEEIKIKIITNKQTTLRRRKKWI
jgi:hypothetical protein